jgi:hypothetical protein
VMANKPATADRTTKFVIISESLICCCRAGAVGC